MSDKVQMSKHASLDRALHNDEFQYNYKRNEIHYSYIHRFVFLLEIEILFRG